MSDLNTDKKIKDLIISIVSYNSLNFLRECLDSILKNPPELNYEIIVFDNASHDGSAEFVKNNYPEVTLIANNKNVGFAAANNRAIERSYSKYILFLNSDCMIYEKSLDILADFMESHPGIGITGPKITNNDGTIQLSCRRFPSMFNAAAHTILTDIFPGNPFSKKYKLTDIDRDEPLKVDWVSGSCMIIRRKALEDTGILDERYFMYVEDLDICYRMWQKNWEVYYDPKARIMHHIAGSSGRGKIKSSFRMQRSVFYFFWKNYRKNWRIVLIPLLVLVLGLRLFLFIIKSIFSKKK
jgi:GT2 family glycosyltransferase